MEYLYVIAGSRAEYSRWVDSVIEHSRFPGRHYVYVSGPGTFRGQRDPQGICVGNWRARPDIHEVLQSLVISCHDVNKIDRIRQIMKLLDIKKDQ